MKWHFFYDEDEGQPYQSMQDWLMEIKYLNYPFFVMLLLVLLLFVYANLTF